MATQIPEGILLIDKPKGLSSFDVVARARRSLKTKKIGHTGTLDPFATGLLVLLVGKYTKLSSYLTSEDKSYEADICLGSSTITDDREGEIINSSDPYKLSELSDIKIKKAIEEFQGKLSQIPPQFSAISIKGERAYKKARRGEHIEIPPRNIEIHDFSLISISRLNNQISVKASLKVSKGTYIRAIARDLGEKLGVFGHLKELKRTSCGKYKLRDASSELKNSIHSVLGIPLIEIDKQSALKLKSGLKPETTLHPSADKNVFLTHLANEPVALVKIEQGRLITLRGF